MSSSLSEMPGSSWSAAAERRIGMQGRQGAPILQVLGLSVLSVADQQRTGGGVRTGAGAVQPPRHASSGPAAPASPTGSGTGGAGSPGDGDDVLVAAATAPLPLGFTAEMALSILVDCFGH